MDLSKYATDLSDEHGVPLLESSDGRSHFLYLIMEIRKHRQPTVFLIEEPDVFMHPGLQKTFLEYLLSVSEEAGHQFFITTHSPYLLDLAMRPSFGSSQQRTSPSLYRVYMTNGCSNLRAFEPTDAWETLRDLGHSSADVLHPNGIIWVEGPSDKIYLKTWLEKFACEEKKKSIKWGVDCDIVWYGGSNLANLSVGFWRQATCKDVSKLLELAAINPNAAIVVDRDDFPDDNMSEHKRRVKDKCHRRCVFFWMTEESTIENYIPKSVKKQLGGFNRKPPRKVDNAKRYREWAREKQPGQVLLEDDMDLKRQIRRLFDKITSWNSGLGRRQHSIGNADAKCPSLTEQPH